jgi:hypothetical protein
MQPTVHGHQHKLSVGRNVAPVQDYLSPIGSDLPYSFPDTLDSL